MATYVISDIHGEYDKFIELLKMIDLRDEDILYILGDVVDRGPHPIKTLLKLMEMPNVICIVGNHELMALECLKFLSQEITTENVDRLDIEMIENLSNWQFNGGKPTIDEFRALTPDRRKDVIDFIGEFVIYEEVTVGGRDYLLVHAGLGNYSPDKDIEDYSLHDLLWARADYSVKYFDDKFVVTGHTPTQLIEENPRPGNIYKHNNHIAIDCGAHHPGGRLAAICLDTMDEFYSN